MYRLAIEDLITHPKFLETRQHMHHSVPKQDHLLRTARYSFRIAKALGADPTVCARAAVLHDLDSRKGTLSNHGAIAAQVAQQMGESSKVCEAIVPHMYPLGPAPTSKEGWVLVLADKVASLSDLTHFVVGLFSGQSLQMRRQLKRSDPYFAARAAERRRVRAVRVLAGSRAAA